MLSSNAPGTSRGCRSGVDQRDGSRASRDVLARIAARWPKIAQVKKCSLDGDVAFDSSREDFLVELLPFGRHPRFIAASPSTRSAILSLGWLIYNWKTIEIEEKIVSPICSKVIHGDLPMAPSAATVEVIAQTLVDEAYHVLMVSRACQLTFAMRPLPRMRIPTEFDLITSLEREKQRHPERWKHDLAQLAIATVSEVFISDYLALLSGSDDVQPIHRMVVEAHRKDEFRHSPIFKTVAGDIYAHLSREQRAYFAAVLPRPVRWFVSHELAVWRSALDQIGFEHTDELLGDSARSHRQDLLHIDYSGVISLAEDLGILDSPIGRESFYREGLLD